MASEPVVLWRPTEARQRRSRLAAYLARLAKDGRLHGGDGGPASYDEAWAWSVEHPGPFWTSVAAHFDVRWDRPPEQAVATGGVTGARWFPGGKLNYAAHALRPPPGGGGTTAVVARSQTRPAVELSWQELGALVGRVQAGLRAAGVRPGDRVAGYLPNTAEALAAMLATAGLGAVWTSCAPETGVRGVLDRLAQVEPTVLLAVDGYRYGERVVSRRDEAEAVRAGLPSVRRAVWLPYLDLAGSAPAGWSSWEELTAEDGPLELVPVPFDHPLYILYSSGTTGKPKAIVHGHGGILLEHIKALALHFDLGPGDRFFWYTTTGWMMWNFCVSGLLVGASVVLFDGNPTWPAADALWGVLAETAATCGGMGAASLAAGAKSGLTPGRDHDLSALRTLGSTGSPLPASAAEWVYEAVATDVLLASFSGGTDVCSGFVGGSPLHPVWAGEIACRCLGAKVEVYDDDGRPVVDREGELVLSAPLPSMPVRFWDDAGDRRYRAAYFERFPGVWAHGDRATLTSRGTLIITGRSDGTLNRGGVRMGTAELYDVVEGFEEVTDSLAVHLEDPAGGPGVLWLFVVVDQDRPVDEAELAARLAGALRRELSPRHVPDRILAVPAVPRTLSGKKLEVPVKRILSGVPVDEALTLGSVADPASLEAFLALAPHPDATGRG